MDDPWGSPWATDTASKNDTAPIPQSGLLSPPPKAFFGGSPNISSQSPWADDNGFGDWGGADQAENLSPSLGWSAWGEHGLGIQPSQLTPKADSSGKRSPTAWPSSPGLKPVLRSRTSSVFRQHLTDPWSTESPWTENTDTTVSLNGDLSLENEGSKPDVQTAETKEAPISSPRPVGTTQKLEEKWRDLSLAKASQSSVDASPVIGAEAHDSPSRPSSTFSIDSEHGPDRQDSPITSIDDDSGHRVQIPQRNLSGKVSELVGMYDGLALSAKEKIEERPPTVRVKSRERSPSKPAGLDVEDAPDFGDFKAVATSGDEDPWKASSDRSLTPKARLKTAFLPENNIPTSLRRNPKSRAHSPAVLELIEKFGPIKFEVDMRVLDQLFPDVPYTGDDDGGEVSDRIITDSFTTTEERRTWYRISRYGSSRKHNSGDEENYQRVNWQSSDTHAETIKIVRRWMEEDSFAGRPTLGGSKRTSVFNWDSASAPVDLNKVFGRKSSVTHSRNTSIAMARHSPKPSVSSFNSVMDQMESSVASSGPTGGNDTSRPVASFGWSSSPVDSSSVTNPGHHTNSPISNVHSPPREDVSLAKASPVVSSIRPPPIAPLKNTMNVTGDDGNDDDDDDEWGEMISSPVVETSTSLNEMLLNQTASSSSTKSALELSKEPVPFERQESATATKFEDNSMAPNSPVNFEPTVGSSTGGTENVGLAKAPADAWACADFSIFDAPSPQVPEPVLSASETTALESGFNPQEPPHSVSNSVPRRTQPSRVILGPIHSSKEELDQAEFVRSIIHNLPDLSYML